MDLHRNEDRARLGLEGYCRYVSAALQEDTQGMRLLKLIPDNTNIDFVGIRFIAFAIDGLLVLIALWALLVHGLNYGIDFTGGVLVEVKSAQTIEAMPQRVGKRRSTAEEPVTARIRRRTEGGNPPSNQATDSDAGSGAGETSPPAPPQNSSGQPPMTFQERLAIERQNKGDGPSPP